MKEQYFTKDNILMKSLDIKNTVLKYSRKNELLLSKEKAVLIVTDMQDFFLKPESHAFIPSAEANRFRYSSSVIIGVVFTTIIF